MRSWEFGQVDIQVLTLLLACKTLCAAWRTLHLCDSCQKTLLDTEVAYFGSFSFSVIFSLFSALVICDVYDNFFSSVCASCSLLTHWGDTNSLDHITGDIFAIWFASISNNREKESAHYFGGEIWYVALIFILNEGGRKNMTTRKMLEPFCPHFLKLGWLFTFFIGHLVCVIISTIKMTITRTECLLNLGMADPPNPGRGNFYNVYIHHKEVASNVHSNHNEVS